MKNIKEFDKVYRRVTNAAQNCTKIVTIVLQLLPQWSIAKANRHRKLRKRLEFKSKSVGIDGILGNSTVFFFNFHLRLLPRRYCSSAFLHCMPGFIAKQWPD